jgi:hypothetical protein
MSRITLLGGSTDRFVLPDGTEGYLEVEKAPTRRQIEKGTPIGVVFVPDYVEPASELDEPGHEVTAGHPDFNRLMAEEAS